MSRSAWLFASFLALLGLPGLAAAEADPEKAAVDPAADINQKAPDARKITFTTSSGTWISVDVAPNGQKLVFDLLGDLYELPIAGGKARRLTSGPAWDVQPRYSPDGQTIAFTSDRGGIDNLWLLDGDGQNPRALTEELEQFTRTADWTPDGENLIARREDGRQAGSPPVELYLFSRHGGAGVALTQVAGGAYNAGPVASADGRYLYFSRNEAGFTYTPDLATGPWQIFRLDRKTGEELALSSGFGGAARPALSPDGRLLVFVSRRDGETVLVLRDLQDGSERLLASGLSRDEMEGGATADVYPGYDFTPDGRSLIFSDHGGIFRIEIASGRRSEIPFLAEVEQWVAPRVTWQKGAFGGEAPGSLKLKVLRRPVLGPGGETIYFEAIGRLWRQPLAGFEAVGAPRRLTPDQPGLPSREYAPALSPDGRWLAFVSYDDRLLGDVYKVPAAGGLPIKLTRQPGHYANPVWSPDGQNIAFLRGSGLELRGRQPEEELFFELHTLPAAGGESRRVTAVGGGIGQHFHPQVTFLDGGARLLFLEAVASEDAALETKTDLVSVRLDGSDRRVHLRLPPVSEVAPSPDQRWVAFTSREQVYLVPWPPVELAEPIEVLLADGPLPVVLLSNPAGAFLGWADGGKTLTFSLGNSFYRMPVERALAWANELRRQAAATAEETAEAEEEDAAAESFAADVLKIELEVPRAAPTGSFVLRGARALTLRGEEILESADLVVSGNRIAAIGPSGTVAIPPGAKIFELAGATLMPGLIDTHAHLHDSAYEIFPARKWEYLANLAYGVTTVYDPSAPTLDVFAQAEQVEAGRMLGPRIYSSGTVLYGGQPEEFWAKVESLDDARGHLQRLAAWGARMIKVYQQPRRAQRRWFAAAAREEQMLLTAEGAGDLFTDLTLAADGFTAFEHGLPVEMGDDVARFLAATTTHYTPTLMVAYGGPSAETYFWQTRNPHDDPKLRFFTPHFALDSFGRRHPWLDPSEYHFPVVAEGAARLAAAGGNVSLGAHGNLQGLGVHWELWAMAGDGGRGRGMTAFQALRAATERAAEKLGLLPDLGTLEKGKLADLLVLEADPLADLHNSEKIRWVIKNGEIYQASNLERIWPAAPAAPH